MNVGMVDVGVSVAGEGWRRDEWQVEGSNEEVTLEPVASINTDRDRYLGPTEESNWVLPGRLLVGAYPSHDDDIINDRIVRSILEQGVQTFVCLQREYQHGAPEHLWRNGQALRPYITDAYRILKSDAMQCVRRGATASEYDEGMKPEDLDFVHFPIVDCATVEDGAVVTLCAALARRIRRGECLYVHCWGGHGRTGTVVCVLLHMLFRLSAEQSLAYCQFVHDIRLANLVVPSPQTQVQRDQVVRVIQGLEAVERARVAALAQAQAQAQAQGNVVAAAPAAPRARNRSLSSDRPPPGLQLPARGGAGGAPPRKRRRHSRGTG
eukprot:g4178.t1